MLASNGEIGEPCGLPASTWETIPASNTPARSQPLSSLIIRRSTTRRCTWAISASWSIVSNEDPSYYPCRGLAVGSDDYSVAPLVRGQVVARAGRYAQARSPGVAAGVARWQQIAGPGGVDRR